MTATYSFVAVGGFAVILGIISLMWFLRRRKLFDSLKLTLFLIKIPKETRDKGMPEKDFKLEISKTEQLLANLAALKKPFVFEAAVPHVGEEISFYLAIPRRMQEVAIKQIQGIWNGASVVPAAEDYNIFNPAGATAAAYVMQKETFVLPVRTYAEIGADTFGAIIGGLAKLNTIGEDVLDGLLAAIARGFAALATREGDGGGEERERGGTHAIDVARDGPAGLRA